MSMRQWGPRIGWCWGLRERSWSEIDLEVMVLKAEEVVLLG